MEGALLAYGIQFSKLEDKFSNFLIARKGATYDVGFGHQNNDDEHIDPNKIKRK